MAIIKCKMCGGDLNLTEGQTVAECEYCFTTQTVPNVDDDKKLALFTRANRLRSGCDFDKAAGVYEAIVADFPEEAEAYWGLVLCKYGIEYVDDPATGKKIPTCHRSSFESILDDVDFEQALENADAVARRVYREEAKQIEEIRKGIIAVSSNEEPYDIFICYKETDENGDRTLDSLLAQDIYEAVTAKGYRTFFARITLEDRLGQEYEPYIFAALNSAKILLAVGTDYEYYNAVWVKNEWSRYLKLMASNKDKHLIPCYKGIDAYDIPKEFARLQAQDLGKVGALQDLLRGIEKLLPQQKPEAPKVIVKEVVHEIVREVRTPGTDVSAPLQRGWDLLREKKWVEADAQFNRVLQLDGKCGRAYLGKLCAAFNYRQPADLLLDDDEVPGTKTVNGVEIKCKKQRYAHAIFRSPEYQHALEYADNALRAELEHYRETREAYRIERTYTDAKAQMDRQEYISAAAAFKKITDYKDSAQLAATCLLKSEEQPDSTLCASLAQIRQRNAPVQQQLLYGLVGTDFLYHDSFASRWKDHKDLLSCISVELTLEKKKDPSPFAYTGFGAATTQHYTLQYGLKADGTVVCVNPYDFQEDRPDPLHSDSLKNIVRLIPYSHNRLLALDKDGSLHVEALTWDDEARKLHSNPEWQGLVDVATDRNGIILGLKENGTVVVYDRNNRSVRAQDYAHWKNIAALCPNHTELALTVEGRLIARANSKLPQEIFRWTDLVAITPVLLGLKADGTVQQVYGGCHYACTPPFEIRDKLEDIVAISNDGKKFIRSDGTVISGDPKHLDAYQDLRLFQSIDTVRQERLDAWDTRIAEVEADCEKYRAGIEANQGIFHKKKRREFADLLYSAESAAEELRLIKNNL